MLYDFGVQCQVTLYNIYEAKLKDEINREKKGVLQISPGFLICLTKNCNLKDSLDKGSFCFTDPYCIFNKGSTH